LSPGSNSSGAKRRKRNDYEKKQKKTSIGTDKEGKVGVREVKTDRRHI
jgi:hypothetical protein